MKSPIQIIISRIEGGQLDSSELLEEAKGLLDEEREMVAQAWIQGNNEGWAMTTDWDSHGYDYYDRKYRTDIPEPGKW